MSSFRSIRDLPPRQRRSRPFRLQIPCGEALPRFFRAHRAGRIVDYLEDKKGRTWCPAWRFSGAPCRARTCDLRIRSPTLYPAELRARAEGQYTPAGPARQEFFRTGERRALWRPAVAARDDQPSQPADPGRGRQKRSHFNARVCRRGHRPASGRRGLRATRATGGAGYGRRGLPRRFAPPPLLRFGPRSPSPRLPVISPPARRRPSGAPGWPGRWTAPARAGPSAAPCRDCRPPRPAGRPAAPAAGPDCSTPGRNSG